MSSRLSQKNSGIFWLLSGTNFQLSSKGNMPLKIFLAIQFIALRELVQFPLYREKTDRHFGTWGG